MSEKVSLKVLLWKRFKIELLKNVKYKLSYTSYSKHMANQLTKAAVNLLKNISRSTLRHQTLSSPEKKLA